jgi:hypothetical protein
MNGFDKLCACLSIPIGICFILLGIVGTFAGASAHFTLPPILGCLPFFLGWAMSITLLKFWGQSNHPKEAAQNPPYNDHWSPQAADRLSPRNDAEQNPPSNP